MKHEYRYNKSTSPKAAFNNNNNIINNNNNRPIIIDLYIAPLAHNFRGAFEIKKIHENSCL